MYFLCLSANWQPGAKRVLNQPRRAGGKKKVGFLGWSQPRKQSLVSYILLKAGTGGWTTGWVRKRERFMFCANKRAEEKSPIGLGSPTVKETAVHTEKEWSGKKSWKSNQKAICWPGMSCPGGTEPILSSRMPHRGATASPLSKLCQDEALKLHEPHAKKVAGPVFFRWWSQVKHCFLSGGLGRLGHPASPRSRNAEQRLDNTSTHYPSYILWRLPHPCWQQVEIATRFALQCCWPKRTWPQDPKWVGTEWVRVLVGEAARPAEGG